MPDRWQRPAQGDELAYGDYRASGGQLPIEDWRAQGSPGGQAPSSMPPAASGGLVQGGAIPLAAGPSARPDVVATPNQLVPGATPAFVAPTANPLGASVGQYSPAEAANLVGHYESEGLARAKGIDPYYIGVGGADLSKAQLDQYGFPIWEGHGNSHAAGRYQFQPATWHQYAKPLGITDFSQASQDQVFRAAYLDQGFGPWRPFNTSLDAHLSRGGVVPAEWASSGTNPLVAAGQPEQPAQRAPWEPPPAAPQQQSPWQRLLALSALAQGMQLQPMRVRYDPRAGMVAAPPPVEATHIMQAGLPELPSSGLIPRRDYLSQHMMAPSERVTTPEMPSGRAEAPQRLSGGQVGNIFTLPQQYARRYTLEPVDYDPFALAGR